MKIKNLKLIARTTEDLRVVSAYLQDSIVNITNIASLDAVQSEVARVLPDGVSLSDVISKPSFCLVDIDGSQVDLFYFLFQVLSSWEGIFKKYNLPYFDDHFKAAVFLESHRVYRTPNK